MKQFSNHNGEEGWTLTGDMRERYTLWLGRPYIEVEEVCYLYAPRFGRPDTKMFRHVTRYRRANLKDIRAIIVMKADRLVNAKV